MLIFLSLARLVVEDFFHRSVMEDCIRTGSKDETWYGEVQMDGQNMGNRNMK